MNQHLKEESESLLLKELSELRLVNKELSLRLANATIHADNTTDSSKTVNDDSIVERAFGRVLALIASGLSISDAMRFECSSRGALHPGLSRFARAFRLHDNIHRPLSSPILSTIPLFDIACVVGPCHTDVIQAIKEHTTEGVNLSPKVLYKFPTNASLPAENFAQFCLPTGATLETIDEHEGTFPPESTESRLFGHHKSLHRGLSSHCFILAGSDTDSSCEMKSIASGQQAAEVAAAIGLPVEGRVRYCVCISLLEPYLPIIHCDASGKVDVGIHHQDDKETNSSHPFVVERVFCIVSRYPLFGLLFKIARSFAANWRLSAFTSINLAIKELQEKAAVEKAMTASTEVQHVSSSLSSSISSSPPLPPSTTTPTHTSTNSHPKRSLFGWTRKETLSPKIDVPIDAIHHATTKTLEHESEPISGEQHVNTSQTDKKKKKSYMSRVVGSYWKKKSTTTTTTLSESHRENGLLTQLQLTIEIEKAAEKCLEESMILNCSSSLPLLSTLFLGQIPSEGLSLNVSIEINQQLGNSRTQYIRPKAPTLNEIANGITLKNLTVVPSDLRLGEFPHLPFTLSQPVIDALDNTKNQHIWDIESVNCGVSLDSDEARLGIVLWTAPIFFSLLPLDSILLLVGAALTERKIIFVAQKLPLECVSACALCMSSLIRPLQWVGPLLPTTPDALIDLLMSPVPLIAGVTYLPEGFELDESTIVVDLDDASLKLPEVTDADADETYLGIRLPLYNDLYYKLLPLTSTVHVVSADSTLAPKVVFVASEDQSKACVTIVEAINTYVRSIVHYTISHGISSASPLRQRFLPSLGSIKVSLLRNCRPSEVLFWRRFLGSQLLSSFLEATSRRLIALEPLSSSSSSSVNPADEIEIEANEKSIRVWDTDRFQWQTESGERTSGVLKRTTKSIQIGKIPVNNHIDDDDDNNNDDDNDDDDDDDVSVNADFSILSKKYSSPFALAALIKKMKAKGKKIGK